MRYGFLEKVLKEEDNTKEDETMKLFKQNQRFSMIIYGCFIIISFFTINLVIISSTSDNGMQILLPLTIVGLTVSIFITTLIFYFKNRKNAQIALKYLIFILFYAIQFYWTLYRAIVNNDPTRTIRNLYILYIMSDFFLVIFFRFNYFFIVCICVSNLSISIYIETLSSVFIPQVTFGWEVFFSFLIPCACLITRIDYENLIRDVLMHTRINKKVFDYSNFLLDQISCFFFTMSNQGIEFSNSTFRDFLNQKFKNFSSENTEKENLIININNNEPTQENLINNKNEIKNNYNFELENQFLKFSKFSYLIPQIKDYITDSKEDIKIKFIDLLTIIQKNPSIGVNDFIGEKFHFLGISELTNEKTNKKFYHNVSFRKMKNDSVYWIEILMNDITLSKKINLIDESFRLKEKILSKIAHEFKTPLISVISLSSQIQDSFEKNKKYLKKIDSDFNFDDENLEIINNLAEKSEKKLNIKYEIIQLKEILEFVYRILDSLLTYKKNRTREVIPLLEIDESIKDLNIKTDSLRVKQILLNLVSNAVKFTKSGHIKIKAEIDKTINISIEDTGMGIKPEEKIKLFSDFNMLETHLNENEMGMGLGLSISMQIAKAMNYTLTLDSIYNNESTFTLSIPLQNICIKNEAKSMNLIKISNNKIKMKKRSSNNLSKHYLENIFDTAIYGIERMNKRKDYKISYSDDHLKYFTKIGKQHKESKFFNINLNNLEVNVNINNHLNNNQKLTKKKLSSFAYPIINSLVSNISSSSDNSQPSIIDLNNSNEINYSCDTEKIKNEHNNLNISTSKKISVNEEILSNNNKFKEKICNVSNSYKHKKKIVIIDDNMLIIKSIKNLICKLLSKYSKLESYEIIFGFDGIDLLKIIIDDQKDNNLICCIFTDECMEYLSGSTTIKIIRELEISKKIKKCIIYSLSAMNDNNSIFIKDEFSPDEYISKPISEKDLTKVFRKLGLIPEE